MEPEVWVQKRSLKNNQGQAPRNDDLDFDGAMSVKKVKDKTK